MPFTRYRLTFANLPMHLSICVFLYWLAVRLEDLLVSYAEILQLCIFYLLIGLEYIVCAKSINSIQHISNAEDFVKRRRIISTEQQIYR